MCTHIPQSRSCSCLRHILPSCTSSSTTTICPSTRRATSLPTCLLFIPFPSSHSARSSSAWRVTQGPCPRPSQRYNKMLVATSASKTRSSARRQRTTRSPESGAVFAGDPNPSAHTTAPNAGGACSRWVCVATSALSRPPVACRTHAYSAHIDHHCPWMGARCIVRTFSAVAPIPQLLMRVGTVQGFRTYPSFLHFLASVTLLATYIAVICIRGLNFAFRHPLEIVRV